MYEPWMTRASKLAREREMYRRYEIARQLREVKAEHRRRRQRQLHSWVSSLWRCVFSPLAAYWRWSGREDRKPETMQFLGDRLERGTPPHVEVNLNLPRETSARAQNDAGSAELWRRIASR